MKASLPIELATPNTPCLAPHALPWRATMREAVLRVLGEYRDPETGRKLPSTAQEVFMTVWSTITVRETDGAIECDPAHTYIAAVIGCHERTVTRSVRHLERASFLRRTFVPGPDAQYTRVRTQYAFPNRRTVPTRTAWRAATPRQLRREAERQHEATKARVGPRYSDPKALGTPVMQQSPEARAAILAGVRAIAGMDGRLPSLAPEAGERSIPRALPGQTERRGRSPAEPPPFDPAAWLKKLSDAALAGRRKPDGGGVPPPKPPSDPPNRS